MKTCGSAVKLREPREIARASRKCASAASTSPSGELCRRAPAPAASCVWELQPQRRAARATSSPTGEVCG
jgi:hypothetical protein